MPLNLPVRMILGGITNHILWDLMTIMFFVGGSRHYVECAAHSISRERAANRKVPRRILFQIELFLESLKACSSECAMHSTSSTSWFHD